MQTPGFDLDSHRIMLKGSGSGSYIQNYGAVDSEPPLLLNADAERVEMLRPIKTAIRDCVLIPHMDEVGLTGAVDGDAGVRERFLSKK